MHVCLAFWDILEQKMHNFWSVISFEVYKALQEFMKMFIGNHCLSFNNDL